MEVTVKLVGHLVDLLPPGGPLGERPRGRVTVDIEEGAPLPALVERVGLPPNLEYFAMVNADHVSADALAAQVLRPGDDVVLCPPLKGG